jgi:hypothetical protein
MDRSRRPTQRLNVTLPASVMDAVEHRAFYEGRSLSNLVAVLLGNLWTNGF